MAPLSKLTLTSYRRTQPNRHPVEERRSKTLAALEQQKLVLAAALNGQEHTVTKLGWARDADGNRRRVKKTHAVRPWFFQDAEGWVVQLKYGARVVPLDADNNAVIVQSLDDVAAVLDIFAKAIAAGELDKPLAALAQRPNHRANEHQSRAITSTHLHQNNAFEPCFLTPFAKI